jgi:hypothetical protein
LGARQERPRCSCTAYKSVMNSRRRMSAPKPSSRHLSGSKGLVDTAKTGIKSVAGGHG